MRPGHILKKIKQNIGSTIEETTIKELISLAKSFDQSLIDQEIKKADTQMFENGIVAVADISNTNHSFRTKEKSSIYYHTFIELYSLNPNLAKQTFENGIKLQRECKTTSSLVPHANYSVSTLLFDLLKHNNRGDLLSIHNQETEAENQMFYDGSGLLYDSIQNRKFFNSTGKSAIQSTFPYLAQTKTLLVHNTFTSIEDMNWINSKRDNIYWCTCPNANLFIENKLPSYSDLLASNSTITLSLIHI